MLFVTPDFYDTHTLVTCVHTYIPTLFCNLFVHFDRRALYSDKALCMMMREMSKAQ